VSKLEKRMIALRLFYTIANTLSKSFVNVFLYEYTKSYMVMTLYSFIRCGLFPVSDIIGTKIIKKHSYALPIGISLVIISLSLLCALGGTDYFIKNKFYVLIVACITGIGEGLYWFSVNCANQIVTNKETRATYLSISGILNNIGSFIAPLISAFIVSKASNDMIGYRNILYFIFVLYVIITGVAVTINKKDERGVNYSLKTCLSMKDPIWKNNCLGILFYGIANAITLNLSSIMIFNAAGSGGLYSKLLVLFSLVTIISLRFLPITLRKENIKKTFLISAILHVSSTIVLVVFSNVYGAIYFGIANALCVAFYDNAYSKISMDTVSCFKDDMTGRVVANEFYVAYGRLIALGFFVICYFIFGEEKFIRVAVLCTSIFPLFCYKNLSKNINI